MIKMRRITCIILALVLCASLAVVAYAVVAAGIYGNIRGRGLQRNSDFVATTLVTQNPDNAQLQTTVQFTDGLNYIGQNTKSSERGLTSFTYDFPIAMTIDCVPVGVYCSFSVLRGSQSHAGYTDYRYYTVDMSGFARNVQPE